MQKYAIVAHSNGRVGGFFGHIPCAEPGRLAEVVVAQRLVNNGDNVISPCSACGTGHVV